MLVIKQKLSMSDEFSEPLPYSVGFGLNEECYKLLLKVSQDTGDYVIFDEKHIGKLKSQEEANGILFHTKTVNLNKAQYDKIMN